MTDGVHRLERQEEQEEAEAESARKAAVEETGLEPARKQQKTMEDIARRARRPSSPRNGVYAQRRGTPLIIGEDIPDV